MSKFLKFASNDSPLVISPTLATLVGLNESLVVQQLHYLTLMGLGRTVDGKRYIRMSVSAWHKQYFPFLSESSIRRALESLCNRGIISSRNDLSTGFDRTSWYAIEYDTLGSLEEQAKDNTDLIAYNKRRARAAQNSESEGMIEVEDKTPQAVDLPVLTDEPPVSEHLDEPTESPERPNESAEPPASEHLDDSGKCIRHFEQMDLVKMANGFGQNGGTIYIENNIDYNHRDYFAQAGAQKPCAPKAGAQTVPKSSSRAPKAGAQTVPKSPSSSKKGACEIPKAVQVFRGVRRFYPPKSAWLEIASVVGDEEDALSRWRAALVDADMRGWNPRNVAGALDIFRGRAPRRGAGAEVAHDKPKQNDYAAVFAQYRAETGQPHPLEQYLK